MDIGNSARLFALANLAAADAVIVCWDSKRYFSFWRPVTAIREGERDGNPGTIGAPDWEPLVNTPNYPDYTSGANTVTAAMTTILERFFGTDTFNFTVTSNAAPCDPEDAHVQTFLRRRRRSRECPHPAWHSFPICG